mgnify:CR=1 FL=1
MKLAEMTSSEVDKLSRDIVVLLPVAALDGPRRAPAGGALRLVSSPRRSCHHLCNSVARFRIPLGAAADRASRRRLDRRAAPPASGRSLGRTG